MAKLGKFCEVLYYIYFSKFVDEKIIVVELGRSVQNNKFVILEKKRRQHYNNFPNKLQENNCYVVTIIPYKL